MKPPPELIALDHDEYHAKYVGCSLDGRQFFGTTPFVPANEDGGREFSALYVFDVSGNLLDAQIDDLGTRPELEANIKVAQELQAQRLAALGEIVFCRIKIKPFVVERFDIPFGLIHHSPEEYLEGDEDADEIAEIMELGGSVTLEPGNYMAFHEPWDSGEYDT